MDEQAPARLGRRRALCIARVSESPPGRRRGDRKGRQPAVIPRAAECCIAPAVHKSIRLDTDAASAAVALREAKQQRPPGVWEVLAETPHGRALSTRTAAAAAHRSDSGRTRPRAAAAAQTQSRRSPEPRQPRDDRIPRERSSARVRAGDPYGDDAQLRLRRRAGVVRHDCDSRADRVAVTAGDPRIVGSVQSTAADRRRRARSVAPPDGRISHRR
jgi:hypothetical protein